jgi:hypothetical protein
VTNLIGQRASSMAGGFVTNPAQALDGETVPVGQRAQLLL